jgi:ADP-ribose pyrophosphatase YjhB (NUDIX family)
MPATDNVNCYRRPFPTTDLIIEYKNSEKEGIVLITRKNPPYGLALPGGFAEWGISLEDNARKEAREETGLEIILRDPNHPFSVRSAPDRDPRGHMISIAYLVEGYGQLRAGDDASDAQLYTLDEVKKLIRGNQLAFDHADILKDYLEAKAMFTPIYGARL